MQPRAPCDLLPAPGVVCASSQGGSKYEQKDEIILCGSFVCGQEEKKQNSCPLLPFENKATVRTFAQLYIQTLIALIDDLIELTAKVLPELHY